MPALDEPIKPKPTAAGLTQSVPPARLRVCLVTTEFHGLFKNGGIGTANTGLALELALSGLDVTVAFADSDENGPRIKEGNFDELKAKYQQLGINLDFVPASPLIAKAFSDSRSASYCVYLYLIQHKFDVVYFNDCGGHGYYSLLAKRVGVFRNPPRMYVVTHGPHEWVLELNSLRYWDRWPVITAFLERRSAALADALISPSQYLLDWMTAHGWAMPEHVLTIPNIVKLPQGITPLRRGSEPIEISEIVFFGRLEVRKGVELFCDAIDRLNQSANLNAIRITFMGKFSHVAGLHSGMYLAERARRWRSSLRILCRYGQEEALEYLNRPGVLAVIPSLAENSPCVVAECLQLGLPFVATDKGGTRELVVPEDRDLCLVAPEPRALAAKLNQILKSGHRLARPAVSTVDLSSQWLKLTECGAMKYGKAISAGSTQQAEASPNNAEVLPLVSVCLTHSDRSLAGRSLIESLLRQDYPRFELVVPQDEGGGECWISAALANLESASDRIVLRLFSHPSGDRGAARNAAEAQSSGQYLLFVDEDAVILMPEFLRVFVAATLSSGADIVTGVPLQFARAGMPDEVKDGWLGYFPLGACTELGGFENCFGKGALLVERRAFERSSGFETLYDPEVEDWLFLVSSVLSGLYLEVVPEPLFWYRMKPAAELNRSRALDNQRRILNAYGEQKIDSIKHILETMVNVDRDNRETLVDVLSGVSSQAREIALRVSSSFEPNHEDALRGLVQFFIERQKVDAALDFALHNGRSLLSDAIGSAKALTETLALDATRGDTLDLWHEVVLTDEVRSRIETVSAFPAENLVQTADGIAAHAIQSGIAVLKAAAACPPRARSIRAVAEVDASELPSVSLALVVSTQATCLRLSEQGLTSKEPFWWSGWVPAKKKNGKLELSVSVPEFSEGPLDLHFMCKADENGASEGKLIWESVAVMVSVNRTIASSIIESTEKATPVPRQVLDQGILLTQNPDFPFPLFVPGDTTLVHPSPGRVTLVRLAGAVPPGTKAVRSVVSVELAEAHPVQFAVWIRPSSAPVSNEAEFTETDSFSGWFNVRDQFRRHRFTAALGGRASQAMDIYLATRVVEYPDVHYCHSVWHELLLLE